MNMRMFLASSFVWYPAGIAMALKYGAALWYIMIAPIPVVGVIMVVALMVGDRREKQSAVQQAIDMILANPNLRKQLNDDVRLAITERLVAPCAKK